MTGEPIKPALSKEEWERVSTSDDQIWDVIIVNGRDPWHPNSHAIAALALYGQSFGFTREDVDLLRRIASAAVVYPSDFKAGIDDLADRIESLLPPELTPDPPSQDPQ